MKGKTKDGLRLSDIISAVENINGITIRAGTRHPYVLEYTGLRECALAESTHAKHMIVPWVKKVLNNYSGINYDNNLIYNGLRNGKINLDSYSGGK